MYIKRKNTHDIYTQQQASLNKCFEGDSEMTD